MTIGGSLKCSGNASLSGLPPANRPNSGVLMSVNSNRMSSLLRHVVPGTSKRRDAYGNDVIVDDISRAALVPGGESDDATSDNRTHTLSALISSSENGDDDDDDGPRRSSIAIINVFTASKRSAMMIPPTTMSDGQLRMQGKGRRRVGSQHG